MQTWKLAVFVPAKESLSQNAIEKFPQLKRLKQYLKSHREPSFNNLIYFRLNYVNFDDINVFSNM